MKEWKWMRNAAKVTITLPDTRVRFLFFFSCMSKWKWWVTRWQRANCWPSRRSRFLRIFYMIYHHSHRLTLGTGRVIQFQSVPLFKEPMTKPSYRELSWQRSLWWRQEQQVRQDRRSVWRWYRRRGWWVTPRLSLTHEYFFFLYHLQRYASEVSGTSNILQKEGGQDKETTIQEREAVEFGMTKTYPREWDR